MKTEVDKLEFCKLVNIGTHSLNINIQGAGGPTVILEAGGASWSMDWYLVQKEVAKFTTVCSYDRAGLGFSEPSPEPRTAKIMAEELQLLLSKENLPKPYIIVAASFGSHVARIFTYLNKKDVVGLILLDPRHEKINDCMPEEWKQLEKKGLFLQRFLLTLSKLKLLKLFGKIMGTKNLPPIINKLPPHLSSIYLKQGFSPNFFKTNLNEFASIQKSDEEVHAYGQLQDIPVTIVSHGKPDLFFNFNEEKCNSLERIWQQLQRDLTKLSNRCKLVIAENSGHAIQIEQPELVIELIQEIGNYKSK